MWFRRNPALATVAALLMLALAGGFAGVTWQWRKAEHNRAMAEKVVELVTHRLLAQADAEHNPLGRNLTVRELLDRAAAEVGGWVGDQPDIEARVREMIGGAYLSLGQYDRAEEHLLRGDPPRRAIPGAGRPWYAGGHQPAGYTPRPDEPIRRGRTAPTP